MSIADIIREQLDLVPERHHKRLLKLLHKKMTAIDKSHPLPPAPLSTEEVSG